MDFDKKIKHYQDITNKQLAEVFQQKNCLQKLVYDAMSYSIRAGGKRIRPVLALAVCDMLGGDINDAMRVAVSIECIHTYSLIHDDLPAMDDDDMRRGLPSCHIKYGEAIAILAGDTLLNYAFEVMSEAVCEQGANGAKAMSILAKKAGVRGMIAGQTVDLEWTGKPQTKELLDYINERKTSALLCGALMAGAALAGAGEEELSVLEQVGNYVGLAFQIKDDILDVIGDESKLGKPLHSDEKNEKKTYVTLIGVEQAEETVREFSNRAVELLDTLPYENPFLKELLLSLITREY